MRQVWVALWRSVNVGGHNRIRMDMLRNVFDDLGYESPVTHLQSGNVVFSSDSVPEPDRLEEALTARSGITAKVILRSVDAFRTIVEHAPFLEEGWDPGELYVTFLNSVPEADRVASFASGPEIEGGVWLVGQEVFLRCPKGYGRTKFNHAFLERRLGVTATTRGWKVTRALWAMMQSRRESSTRPTA